MAFVAFVAVDALVIAGTPAGCQARLADYTGVVDQLLPLDAMAEGFLAVAK